MKLIIAGSRDMSMSPEEINTLLLALDITGIHQVVSGGASGMDAAGEAWADHVGIPVKKFPAKWDEHGRSAGPQRNREMAEYADTLLLVWDGKSRGSHSMLKEAKALGLGVIAIELSSREI